MVVVAASLFVTSTTVLATTFRSERRDGDNCIVVYRQCSAFGSVNDSNYSAYEEIMYEKIRNEKNGEIKYTAWKRTVEHIFKDGEMMKLSDKSCFDICAGREKEAFDYMDTSYEDIKRYEKEQEKKYDRGESI